jgi:hypothetical protein
LKLLQENIQEKLDTGTGKNIVNRTPIAEEVRARIDKWDCTKLTNFYTSK